MSGSGQLGGGTDWLHGGMATVLANLNNAANSGQSQMQSLLSPIAGPSINYLPNIQGNSQNFINGTWAQPSLSNEIGNYPGQVQQLGNSYLGNGSTLQNLSQSLLGGGGQQLGNSIAAGVGQEGQLGAYQNGALQSIADTNSAGVAGQILDALTYNAPGQYNQGFGAASNVMGNGGFAPGIQGAGGTANNIFSNSGMSPLLQSIVQPLSNIVGAGGNNAQSNALLGGGTPFLQSGGTTNLTQGLAQQGMNLFDQQALMNPAQAAGLAGNLASTATQNQAKQTEANALARGGGAGATVANGMQNQGMADFANQIAQNTAGASSQALQNQQALQLQQQGLGAQAAQGSGQLQNALLGTGGQLANESGTLANNLLGTALGLTPQTQNSATGLLGAGTNIAQLADTGYLGAGNLINSLAGTQGQEALGMGGLQNNMAQGFGNLTNQSIANQNSLLNNVMNAGLGAGQLGTGQFSALTSAQNAGLNTGLGMGNLYNNQYSTYMNPLTSLLQAYGSLANTGLSGQASLFGGGAAQAGQGNTMLLSSLLSSLGGLASAGGGG